MMKVGCNATGDIAIATEICSDIIIFVQYERKYQISNGPFSSVFCIKQRGKRYHTHYAAKYLRANTERAKREVGGSIQWMRHS